MFRQMEKLIELLNKYEKTSFEEDTNWVYEWEEWEYYEPNNRIIKGNWENEEILTQYELCSKQYWFIKWLVENEKIDTWTRNPLFITELVGEQEKQMPYSFYEEMLIRLALSDTPIEDLISYLK